MRKRKRTTAEEWAHVQARLARLEARERELRELLEAGVVELRRRTVEERPYAVSHGYEPRSDLR